MIVQIVEAYKDWVERQMEVICWSLKVTSACLCTDVHIAICIFSNNYVCVHVYIYLNQLWRGRAIMIHVYNQRHELASYIKASCFYSPNFYYFSIVPLDFSLCLGNCRSFLLELVCKKWNSKIKHSFCWHLLIYIGWHVWYRLVHFRRIQVEVMFLSASRPATLTVISLACRRHQKSLWNLTQTTGLSQSFIGRQALWSLWITLTLHIFIGKCKFKHLI